MLVWFQTTNLFGYNYQEEKVRVKTSNFFYYSDEFDLTEAEEVLIKRCYYARDWALKLDHECYIIAGVNGHVPTGRYVTLHHEFRMIAIEDKKRHGTCFSEDEEELLSWEDGPIIYC